MSEFVKSTYGIGWAYFKNRNKNVLNQQGEVRKTIYGAVDLPALPQQMRKEIINGSPSSLPGGNNVNKYGRR